MTEIFPSITVFPAQLPLNLSTHLAIVEAIHNGTTTGRVGQGIVDDTGIRYGLDGPGIESLWVILRTLPNRPWSPPSLLYNGHRVFPEGKAAEVWH